MNANKSTETKSISSVIDSLFDVDAIIKSAGGLAEGEDGGGVISRVMRVASERICAITSDLDSIELKEPIQSTSDDDVLTRICELADSVTEDPNSAKTTLLVIQDILRAAKAKRSQASVISAV